MTKKILVVEDNERNRILLRDILALNGYQIIEASNGEEGIETAMEHKPDLILMDIQMPVMNGISALKAIKDNQKTKKIKVIALTSFAMKGDKEKIMDAGFDGYIAKPIDTRQLPEVVKNFLG